MASVIHVLFRIIAPIFSYLLNDDTITFIAVSIFIAVQFLVPLFRDQKYVWLKSISASLAGLFISFAIVNPLYSLLKSIWVNLDM